MKEQIEKRIKELQTLLEKAQQTHHKALQTLHQCDRDMIALDAAITELNKLTDDKD